jgi:hypothetical protein
MRIDDRFNQDQTMDGFPAGVCRKAWVAMDGGGFMAKLAEANVLNNQK